MSNRGLTLEKVLEEAGLIAKWEARAKKEGKLEVAKNLFAIGLPLKRVVEVTGLDRRALKKAASGNL
jgi:hypothetical protein